jgi:UDP-4-amino-4,6-dideoxy-N-acetyl-beta-L-altrosamine transaminase
MPLLEPTGGDLAVTQKFLPYGRQSIDDSDVQAVLDTLRSDYLTTGPRVPAFEAALCEVANAKHAVAVSNGTAALHAACFAADIGPGDDVVVPAITFVASANCARYQGAEVVFADVDPNSGLMTADTLQAAITPKTKAVVPVHLNGMPVDLPGVHRIARQSGARVIEDAAHALGASLHGAPIGNGAHGDLAIYSFHPVKHITTGEGGAIVTNDDHLAARLRMFRDHGIARTDDSFQSPSPGPWYYEQQELGHNLRLSAIHCALGTSQISRLGTFIARRRAIAARYDALFTAVDHVQPVSGGPEGARSAYHLYPVLIDFESAGKSRAEVMAALRERRIGTQVHYIPVPSQPYYAQRDGWTMEQFPGAAAYYARVLSLPMYPTLEDPDIDRVVDAVRTVLHG